MDVGIVPGRQWTRQQLSSCVWNELGKIFDTGPGSLQHGKRLRQNLVPELRVIGFTDGTSQWKVTR